MKRNLTKVFISLFTIVCLLITAGATICVDGFKEDKTIAACKFDTYETQEKNSAVENIEETPSIELSNGAFGDVNDELKTDETGSSEIQNTDNISENNVETDIDEIHDIVADELEITENKKPIKDNAEVIVEKLVPYGSYASIDRSAYTEAEIELLDTILGKINSNINNHELHEEQIPLNNNFTIESYYKVASYFYVYYGQKRAVDETFDLVNAMQDGGYLRLRYDDIREFEACRMENQKKIDSILSNFTVGTDEHILNQISEYLRNNTVYTNGYYDLSNALNGNAVCNGYALAFNAMANRSGIKSDMCIGKTGDGVYHAWNRVTLNDGTYRFYDITFYDSNGNTKYINSKESFHGSYLINDYTSCWFKY